ncbi:MAG: TlpA family protein disulfide reductase [Phycisphaerales bacterium]|nr:TlpA family protein disulfide reductase [Phycisphaerales bacterium]
MRPTGLAVLLMLVLGGAAQEGREPLAVLRDDVERALRNQPTTDSLLSLAERARRLVTQSDDLNDRLSGLKLLTQIGFESTADALDGTRACAIRELSRVAPKSPRARAMLVTQCLPPLHLAANHAERRALVERHDGGVAQLLRETRDESTRCDLTLLRCLPMIEAFRAWPSDWTTDAAQTHLSEQIQSLKRSSIKTVDGAEYAKLAVDLQEELRDAPFGRDLAGVRCRDLDGKAVSLGDYRGRVVVLSFWSSWCVPCLKLVPEEADLMRRLESRGLTLIGVNSDADAAQARRTAAERGIHWNQIWCPPEEKSGLVAQLHIRQWPSVVVLDRNSRVFAKFVGSAYQPNWSIADVEREVLRALAEEKTGSDR